MNNESIVLNNAATQADHDDHHHHDHDHHHHHHDPHHHHGNHLGNPKADGGINTGEAGGMWPLAGEIKENNFADVEIAKQLVDPSILDFRPVEGGALTRGPELIGPYQERAFAL